MKVNVGTNKQSIIFLGREIVQRKKEIILNALNCKLLHYRMIQCHGASRHLNRNQQIITSLSQTATQCNLKNNCLLTEDVAISTLRYHWNNPYIYIYIKEGYDKQSSSTRSYFQAQHPISRSKIL